METLNARLRREGRGMRSRLNLIQRGKHFKNMQAIELVKLQQERVLTNTSLETQEQKLLALQEKLSIDRLALEKQMEELKTALFGKGQEISGLKNQLKVASQEARVALP